MRTNSELYEVGLRAKAWYTKYQQQLPEIRAKRLLLEGEHEEIYGSLSNICLAINAINCLALSIETRNTVADWLSDYQIAVDVGQTYFEHTYSFQNNYVIFSQNV